MKLLKKRRRKKILNVMDNNDEEKEKVEKEIDKIKKLRSMREKKGGSRLVKNDEIRIEKKRKGNRESMELEEGERG